jgi:hypothetical protein
VYATASGAQGILAVPPHPALANCGRAQKVLKKIVVPLLFNAVFQPFFKLSTEPLFLKTKNDI